MDCKHYFVGGKWVTENTLKDDLRKGLLQEAVNAGKVKPFSVWQVEQLSEEQEAIAKVLDDTFQEPKIESKIEPKIESKVESKAKVKEESKSEAEKEPKPFKELDVNDSLKDNQNISHKVTEYNPTTRTFKTKDAMGRNKEFAIKENKKTGGFYADEVRPTGMPKTIDLPDFNPGQSDKKENARNVQFTDSQNVSEEARNIANKISWKPSELIGKWSANRLSGFTPGKEGFFSRENIDDDVRHYQTLGEKMTDLINQGLMTEQEAKDIKNFLKKKEDTLRENNKKADKKIIKESTTKVVLNPIWYMIPKNIRDSFNQRLRNLIVNLKYNVKDAIALARKDTLDEYLKLGELNNQQTQELEEQLLSMEKELEDKIAQSSESQGSGIAKRNNLIAPGIEDDFESFNTGKRTTKQIFDDAIEYVTNSTQSIKDRVYALHARFEDGERPVLNEDDVARICVLKKITENELKKANTEYFKAKEKMSELESLELLREFEQKYSELLSLSAKIATISNLTAATQSSAFRLRGYLLSEDFDINLQIAKEQRAKGRELTNDEKRELLEIKAKYDELEAELISTQERLKEAENTEKIENYISLLKSEIEDLKKNQGTTEGGTTENGTVKGKDNKPSLKEDKLNLTKDYIMQFIEQGITEAEDLVRAVKSNLENQHGIKRTERQIADLISGYGEKTFTTLDENEEAYRRAKSILTSLSKIEDAKEGKRPFPQSGESREVTEKEKDLRKELKVILDSMQLTPEEQREFNIKKLNQVKKRLDERIRQQKKKNKKIYDLDIPSVLDSDKDLKGEDKAPIFLTKEQAINKLGNENGYAIDVEASLNDGTFFESINNGEISASDVVSILESYEITPTKDILKLRKQEVEEARKTFSLPETAIKRALLDDEVIEKKIELQKIKEDTEYRLQKIENEQKSATQKWIDAFLNVFSLPKTAMSVLDLSAPLRQGYVYLASAPVKELLGQKGAVKDQWRAFKQMHKFAWNPELFKEHMAKLKQDPLYHLMKESGLDLTESSKQEEAYIGNQLANALPVVGQNLFYGIRTESTKQPKGLNIAGRSEASYAGFLNLQRERAWRDMYNALSVNPEFNINTKEGMKILKTSSQFINAATGRGKVPVMGEELQGLLSRFFFSPKLIASRIRLATGGLDLPKGIARDYAQKQMLYFLAAQASLLSLVTTGIALGTATDDEEKEETPAEKIKRKGTFDEYSIGNKNLSISMNPTATNFLKVKIGETSIDLTAGIGMVVRAAAQYGFQQQITSTGVLVNIRNKGDETTYGTPIIQFLENKRAPTTALLMNTLEKGKKDEDGIETIKNLVVPLIIRDIEGNFNNKQFENNPTLQKIIGTAITIGSFYGLSANTPQETDKAKRQSESVSAKEKLIQELEEGNMQSLTPKQQRELLTDEPKEKKSYEQRMIDKQLSYRKKAALLKMGVKTDIRRKKFNINKPFGDPFKNQFKDPFKDEF
jgi:hypothetical protein